MKTMNTGHRPALPYELSFQNATSPNALPSAPVLSDTASFLHVLTSCIRAHLHDPSLCLPKLLRLLGMSRSDLHRKLKAATGMSATEYIRYLRLRQSTTPDVPLWATQEGGRLTYTGLRDIVRRRAREAGVPAPTLHAFRRGFALLSLRNGADIYSLQRLMGHTTLQVLRRYLNQTDADLQETHRRTGPVDALL